MNNKDYLGTFEGVLYTPNTTKDGRVFTVDPEEIVKQMEQKPMLGELFSPGEKPKDYYSTNISNAAFAISDVKVDEDGSVVAKGVILNTPVGRLANDLLVKDEPIALSVRGVGDELGNIEVVTCDLSYNEYINKKYDNRHKIKYNIMDVKNLTRGKKK